MAQVTVQHEFEGKTYEIDAEVHPGSRSIMPSMNDGGHPGDAPEVEILSTYELDESGQVVRGLTFQEYTKVFGKKGMEDVDEKCVQQAHELAFDMWEDAQMLEEDPVDEDDDFGA